jgi:hypothetical protein
VDTVDKDDSYDDNNDDVASIGYQKTGRSPNDPANRASNGCLEMRSPKVPTRSGCDTTTGTVDDDISSSGVLPIASNDEFASKERGHEPDYDEVAGAAAFRMRQVAASAGGGLAAGARCLADGMFIRAILGNDNAVAASARRPDGYARRHKSVEAAGAASEAWSRPREQPHSMPSGRHGLGWASHWHETPGGRQTGWLRETPRERRGCRSGLRGMPSGRRGLGWAGCRHKTTNSQQFDLCGQQRSSRPLRETPGWLHDPGRAQYGGPSGSPRQH